MKGDIWEERGQERKEGVGGEEEGQRGSVGVKEI